MDHHLPISVRRFHWSRLLEERAKDSRGWDLLVVGGGITGAGILREAARQGLSAALLEQRDFAWGTSSRSSKMIHGGLRYLLSGNFKLVRASVKERDRLLREAPGLIEPLGFLFSHYTGQFPGPHTFGGLLSLYDLFANQSHHRYYPVPDYLFLAPHIAREGLRGGTHYLDAVTDDARLVLRSLQEACLEGAIALNYVKVESLLTAKGRVVGVSVRDEIDGKGGEVFARVVVNATGVWAQQFRSKGHQGPRIRPLRGSHLVFPFWRLPVAQGITLRHPQDSRPVFVFPWEGVTIAGTTDLDHKGDLDREPCISRREVNYLLNLVDHQFPSIGIREEDILSTYSGIRPVVGGGRLNPAREKRNHAIWEQDGMISVSGGKLTTFRLIALDVLRHAAPALLQDKAGHNPASSPLKNDLEPADDAGPEAMARSRLASRYGSDGVKVMDCAESGELERIPGTNTLWAEIRWAARTEAVMHLEDLLLRRVRLGVLLAGGGSRHFDRIQSICRQEQGWDEKRWKKELAAYQELLRECYSLPAK
jgi:glycerol-3-phosphate dehydrogenase